MRVDCTGTRERQANLRQSPVKKCGEPPPHPPVFPKRAQKVLKTKDRRCKERQKSSEVAGNNVDRLRTAKISRFVGHEATRL